MRWLIPPLLLALAPKCLLCVLAYASAGAALGLGGRETCGALGGVSWSTGWLAAGGAAAGLIAVALLHHLRRRTLHHHE